MGFTPNFQGSLIMASRIIILSAAVFLVAQAFSIDPFKIDKRWERYKKAYNKTYPSDSEEARRHAIWKNNTMLIVEHNKLFHANKTTFRLGMNVHGDMTATEFAARFNGFRKKHPNSHGPWNPSSQVDVRDLPAEVNWEPISRPLASWCHCLNRTWWTAAGLRATWAVMGGLWTRLSTTRSSTRALTLRHPTHTRRWTERVSSTQATLGPQSSPGPMWPLEASPICRRRSPQLGLSVLRSMPASTPSSCTHQESTMTTTAVASSWTTEFWLLGTEAPKPGQSRTTGW